MTTHLLFLHGVVRNKPPKSWQDGLEIGLQLAGYHSIDAQIIEPEYPHFLTARVLPKQSLPPRTVSLSAQNHSARGRYEVERSRLRHALEIADSDIHRDRFEPGPMAELPRAVPVVGQAMRYVRDEKLRANVLGLVLRHLPKQPCEIVVIGHSLGSLIAIDLLGHLPANITVSHMLTIGSPGGIKALQGNRLIPEFPYSRVRSWLNLLSVGDIVTAGRGLSWLLPAALDARVSLAAGTHSSSDYLATRRAGIAVGEALFNAPPTRGCSTPAAKGAQVVRGAPTDFEQTLLFALAYAHKVRLLLRKQGSKSEARYAKALAMVQSEMATRLQLLAEAEDRACAVSVTQLSNGRAPATPKRWTGHPDDALDLLIVAATTNLIAPYVVDDGGAQEAVLEEVATAMGAGSPTGRHVAEALAEARRGLKRSRWDLIALAAVGVGLVALGPFGIAAGAAAGTAGAAAITSGLAAFGPGGMAGGLALAGVLTGTGAAVTTASIALAASSQALEIRVARHMTRALARTTLKLPKDIDDWVALVDIEATLSSELAAHSDISDGDSSFLKSLRSRADLLRRAIEWMIERDLGPTQVGELSLKEFE